MTTRSVDSTLSFSSTLRAKTRMTDADVYQYLLRVAYLSFLTIPRPAEPPARTSTPKAGPSKAETWTSSLFSIGDLFKDSGSSSSQKSVKFPKDLIKVLQSKMEAIAMGRDPSYTDQYLRQTIGVYYGTFKEPTFQKQMKENRKIEELILIFVTTAQATLKKRLPGDEWKAELNNQVGQFVKIIRGCLRTIHGVPKELIERLDGYSAKVTPKPITLSKTESSSSNTDSRPTSVVSGSSSSYKIDDMQMVKTVGNLFGVEDDQLQRDINAIKRIATEKAALLDLKSVIKNINLQNPFPANRDDFETESGYQHFRTTELSTLSQLMMTMCQFNPDLVKSTPSEVLSAKAVRASTNGNGATGEGDEDGADGASGARSARSGSVTNSTGVRASVGGVNPESVSAAIDEDDEATVGNFVFIPPDPKAYYRRALEICIDHDLDAMQRLPEDEEVSLRILSKSHFELLNEAAIRWRLSHPYRVVVNLDVIKYKYDRGDVPLDCITEALSAAEKAAAESELERWTIHDRKLLVHIYGALFQSFLRFLYETFQANIIAADPEEIIAYVSMLQDIHQSRVMESVPNSDRPDLDRHLEELKDGIRIMAIQEYSGKTTDIFSIQADNETVPLLMMIDWIEKGAKKLDKRFPEPILGVVDPVALVLEKQVPLFLDDLELMRAQILALVRKEGDDNLPFEDIIALYKRVQSLLRMYSTFCPNLPLNYDITLWFAPHVQQWLVRTERKTTEWVQSAISADSFSSDVANHSSSIEDLFETFKQPVEFIRDLKWPDAYQNARFLTSMSKTISRSIEQYCNTIEELFMEEMFPRTAEGGDAAARQNAWVVRAKATLQDLQGEKRVEPFRFTPTSCVKLNNIEAARNLLDKMYNALDADEQARILTEHGPEVPNKEERVRNIFTIKIVLGENLHSPTEASSSNRLDSFVTLSDERGAKIAKTRTIYETSDPRWEEVFDIPVAGSMWLAATVWDRKLVGDHTLCGRAYLRLDPRYFGDFLSHELWLDLDTRGRLLFRVSMEGEKDDIQFYFGRAFRSLKRTENDMVRIIVDKMSAFIRQCLSRTVLRNLVKTSGLNFDKAIVNVKGLFNQAIGNSGPAIPPPPGEMLKKPKQGILTDVEIEEAIGPLFDYLDDSLATLKSSLSETAALTVMTKVWKEVLLTIEGLLVPPLSDAPSDMQPLSDKEVEIVFKWLKFLKDYFNANEDGVENGVPLETLQNQKYREIFSYTLYHDMDTDTLMEECVREMQQALRKAPSQRAKNKSVYQQRNLGTIKQRKREKRQEQVPSNTEMIMKILRMRHGTSDFLAQQLQMMNTLQQHVGGANRGAGARRSSKAIGAAPLPPLPQQGGLRDSRGYY